MTLERGQGNLLTADVDALVNTVNTEGVMGKGLALQFKKAFPEAFSAYEDACKAGEVTPGRMHIVHRLASPRFIINFPTKRHWKQNSRMEDIEAGLVDLVNVIRERGIRSIAIPPLGAGLGGLDWSEVKPRIVNALAVLPDVRVLVFEPKGAPAHDQMAHAREVPKMTPGRAALVELMQRYLGGLLDPFVTLLEVHKLMYFMQEAGEPLRLKYVKAPYGPYAENLRHVLRAIEGHLVAGYADGGDAPDKPLTLVPGAVDDANAFLEANALTRERFDRVGRLVEGFETPFGLELLATVHWVARHESPGRKSADVVERTYAWNDRKRQFTPRQIGIALNVLTKQGWLEAAQVGETAT